MLVILACLPLLFAAGSEARAKRDAEGSFWREMRELLPEEYAKTAEVRGLNNSNVFKNIIIKLTYEQIVQETEALAARQHILQEYVDCSCPRCPEHNVPKNRSKREIDFEPLRAVTNLLEPCDSEAVLKTIKLLRVNLATTQLTNQQLALRVACNCPHADKCRSILDPLVYSLISGQNDTEMNRIYWQNSLKGFPQLVERGMMDSLTGAASSILGYVFQNLRPKPTTPKPSTQKPEDPTPEPESPSNAMKAPPAPPSIFVSGQEPSFWQGEQPIHQGCPEVHVNITNNTKKVPEKKEIDLSSNSTIKYVEEPEVTTYKN
ncbi:uncharacterized protein [Halyomorpha halys]|uniref:uncharacterized protein n=1 Tax=Halyomorpha halys TaxID=286706 RepID=UPI0006D527A0|nr:uncharacterized protein LOC106677926 [Halyomorpha halys]